jgi:hypothetical protein
MCGHVAGIIRNNKYMCYNILIGKPDGEELLGNS